MSHPQAAPARDEAFGAYYRQHLVPLLAPLEERRRRVRRRILLGAAAGLAAGGVAFLLLAVYGRSLDPEWGMLAGFMLVPGLMVPLIVWSASSRGFTTEFKLKVIAPVARFVDPNLQFEVSPGISQHHFEASQLFTSGIDRYHSEDRVFGTMGRTSIEFSEVHAQRKTQDSKGRSHYSTIFRGLFMIADFHKDFHGRTMVVPDFAERWMGRFGRSVQALGIGRPGSLVKLEDPDFERAFAVYADDPVEARYILSPSMMRRILAFAQKHNSAVSLSFHHSKLYLAIALDHDLFEPPLWKTLLDPALVEEYRRDLQRAVAVVEDLNLNTRIWSKA